MEYVAGLDEQLGRKARHGQAQAGRGGLKGRVAAPAPSFKFCLKQRQGSPVHHRRKALRISVDRRESDSRSGDSRMIQQISNQQGRQQRQIEGQKAYPDS